MDKNHSLGTQPAHAPGQPPAIWDIPAQEGAVPVFMRLDGAMRHEILHPELPLSSGQSLEYRADTGFVFSYPAGQAGLYFGDRLPLAGAQALRLFIGIKVNAAEEEEEEEEEEEAIILVFRFHAEDDTFLGDHTLPQSQISDTGNIVSPPARALHMRLGLKLTGDGSFHDLRVTLRRLGAHPDLLNTLPATTRKANAEAIRECFQNRKYWKGVQLYNGSSDPDDLMKKHAMRCHAMLHNFEETAEIFEKLSSKSQKQAANKILYIRALANLKKTEKIHGIILHEVMNFKGGNNELEFLLMAYPFAIYLSEALAGMVLARILSCKKSLESKHLNQILRCTHDLSNQQKFLPFFELMAHVESFNLETKTQHAKVDLLKSQAAFIAGAPQQILEKINDALDRFSLYKLALPENLPALDFHNVYCPLSVARTVHGPTVSVLMTSFNSESTIEYAIRSILNQTYADIELIVIDDCSTDNSCKIVKKLAAQDRRITLISLNSNAGTYVAKNYGLAKATGEFVTCQDSDDWAHPEKIERLVEYLKETPDCMGVMCQHFRYDPKRGLRGRGGYIQPDASSLTYRRKPVAEKIGFYDSVRAAADTEFQRRIEHSFGLESIRQIPDLLSLVLWSETSLSGGGIFGIDDDAGIFTKPRNLYRSMYFKWHESTNNYFIPFPLGKRPFDIPEEMKP